MSLDEMVVAVDQEIAAATKQLAKNRTMARLEDLAELVDSRNALVKLRKAREITLPMKLEFWLHMRG